MTPEVEATLRRLIAEHARGPEALRALLVRDPATRTPEVVAAARGLLKQAAEALDVEASRVFTAVAFAIHDARGEPRDAMACACTHVQVGFARAAQPADYIAVGQAAARRADEATSIGIADVALQLRIVAADCAYFAANASSPADRLPLLRTGLALLAADPESTSRVALEPGWAFRMASLCNALTDMVRRRVLDPTEVEPQLGALASITEHVIPIDLAGIGDPRTADSASLGLATLSYRHGDTELAEARVATVLARHPAPEDQLPILRVRYLGLRESAPGPRLGELRRAVRARIDAARGQCRSRLGRLLARQQAADTEGLMLQDDAADPAISDADGFAAIESGKARLLLDQLTSSEILPPPSIAEQVAELERAALGFAPRHPDDVADSEYALISEQSIGDVIDEVDTARRVELVGRIEHLYRDAGAGLREPAEISGLSPVMAALRDDEALFEYAIPHRFTHPAQELQVLAVTRATTKRLRIALDDLPRTGMIGRMAVDGKPPLDISPLGHAIAACRIAIRTDQDDRARAWLEVLHGKVVQPLIDAGFEPSRFARWIIVPHGPLHYLPFGALAAAGGRPLIQQVALTFAPSSSVWLDRVRRSPAEVKAFLGVANPALDPGLQLPSLIEAERELTRIERTLSALHRTVLVGPAATEATLREQVAGRQIVHFACHGEFPLDAAIDDHRILLAPGDGHDGLLHAAEIRRLDLTSAELVVMNICNGGLYRVGPGDEPYGLLAATLVAGAHNVLGTLWPVEDRSARVFVSRFYQRVLEVGPASALQDAAGYTIDGGARLSQWAGFVMVGPGRPLAAGSALAPARPIVNAAASRSS